MEQLIEQYIQNKKKIEFDSTRLTEQVMRKISEPEETKSISWQTVLMCISIPLIVLLGLKAGTVSDIHTSSWTVNDHTLEQLDLYTSENEE